MFLPENPRDSRAWWAAVYEVAQSRTGLKRLSSSSSSLIISSGLWVREDWTAGWHHRLNGKEFEQTPGDSEGQGSLACYSPWGGKESDTPEQLNNDNNTVG